jgi:hypothetical protein
VASYYNLHKRIGRTFPIPITGERVKKTLVQKPAKMNLNIYFGPQEIREVKEIKEAKEKK